MEIIIEQIFILFAFAAIGFTLAKCNVIRHEHSAILSKLLVYVFLPANIIKTFARNCTISYICENYIFIFVSAVIVVILALLMHFVAKLFSADETERSIYEYSMIIPNFGYMGYTFAEALFGSLGLMNAMMFAMPMSFYTYTVGYCILSKRKYNLKNLINPTMLSLMIGIILGVSGLGKLLPDTAFSLLDKASACMAPVSMLLTGIVISEFGMKRILKNPRVYIITLLRLFFIPIVVGGAVSLLGEPDVTRIALLLYCMPCGLNTVVFVKNAGNNCETGAGLALISNILACLSIPLILLLFGIKI